jgi:hypothetical protein
MKPLGTNLAVKVLAKHSKQGDAEFQTEVPALTLCNSDLMCPLLDGLYPMASRYLRSISLYFGFHLAGYAFGEVAPS